MVRRIGAFFFTLALVACGSSSDSALTGDSGGSGGSAGGGAAGQAGEGGSSGSTEAGGQGGSVSSGGAVSGGQGGSSTTGGTSSVGGSSQGGGGQGGEGQGGGGQGGSAQGGSAGVGAFSAGGSAGVGGSSGGGGQGGSAGGGQGGTSPNGQGVIGCGDTDCRLFEGAVCCLTENPGNYCFALNPNQPGNLPERCDCEGILCDSVELFCDGPEDCPGQVCCFEKAPASDPEVACQASCEGAPALRRDAVCKLGQANACPGGGQCQTEESLPQGIGTCR